MRNKCLFSKQIGVRTSCCGRKNKFVFKNLIHQKPAGFYMALPKVIKISCQLVVFVFLRQRIPEARRFKTSTSFSKFLPLFFISLASRLFDLYRQSRTNQSSSIEATASCAVLKGPCRFVRFRLSETAVSNENGSALCLTAKGSPLFSI